MTDQPNGDSFQVTTPFFSTKVAGKNFTLRDIVLLLVFGAVIYSGVNIYNHAEGAEKSSAALLKEIKDTGKQQTDTQKNIAFYQCRTACLLEQPPNKKDGSLCDRICLPVKQ